MKIFLVTVLLVSAGGAAAIGCLPDNCCRDQCTGRIAASSKTILTVFKKSDLF